MASEACCAAGNPFPRVYEGQGTVTTVDGLRCYITGPKTSRKALIFAADIFGFGEPPKNGGVRRSADLLAAAGFLVILPDFFRGNDFDQSVPLSSQEGKEQLGKWWVQEAGFDRVLDDCRNRIMPHIKAHFPTVAVIGAIGTCWGGLMTISLAQHAGAGLMIDGIVSVHGARLSPDHAAAATVPLCLLPAGDDPSVAPLQAVIEDQHASTFAGLCVYHQYASMHHGFFAARGDWSVTDQFDCANDVVAKVSSFFERIAEVKEIKTRTAAGKDASMPL